MIIASISYYIYYCVNIKYMYMYMYMHMFRLGSSVGIATDYGLDVPVSNPDGNEIFHPSKPALGPTQPPLQWVSLLCRYQMVPVISSPRQNKHSLKLRIKTYLFHRLRRLGMLLNFITRLMLLNIVGFALQSKLIPRNPQIN